jgi:hypothetical protein
MTSPSPQIRVANLKSKQGRKIRLEYVIEPNPTSGIPPAYNVVYLAIFVDGLPDDRITAVIVDRYYIPGDEMLSQNVYITELSGNDGVFTGFIPPPIPASIEIFAGFNDICLPQIAVVANGVWQIDPVQPGEQHNFNFAWMF